MGNIFEATILSGKFQGEVVLLPRIPMIPSDSPLPFKHLQLPICLAFAMTINKAQGQTMTICGLDLENPCFSHGQLYVACSRVGKPYLSRINQKYCTSYGITITSVFVDN